MGSDEFLEIMECLSDAINAAALDDGVESRISNSYNHNRRMHMIDVNMKYKGYVTIDRFNSTMSIDKADVDDIAARMLSSLFFDYFEHKLKSLNNG